MTSKLLLAFSSLLSSAAWAAGPLSAQYNCYRQIMGKSEGANFRLENDSVLVPSAVPGKKGFHIFTEKMAYFCELPAKPQGSNDQFDYYYLDLRVGDAHSLYMTYSDLRSDRKHPGIATMASPANKNYETPKCREQLNDETRAVFAAELKDRIASTFQSFVIHRDVMRQRYKKDENPGPYVEALRECAKVPELSEEARAQIAKFPLLDPAKQAPAASGSSK